MENDTREKVIAAAIPLFAKKGFAAVSIREIAAAAGVNVAAISYYFGGKEALYHAILDEQIGTVAQALEAVGEDVPPEERLKVYFRAVSGIHRSRPYVTRFIQSELTNPTAAMEKVLKNRIFSFYQFLHKAIQDGVNGGQFRTDVNVGLAVLSFVGILNFYFIAKPIFREFFDASLDIDGDYVDQAMTIFLHGIRGKENG